MDIMPDRSDICQFVAGRGDLSGLTWRCSVWKHCVNGSNIVRFWRLARTVISNQVGGNMSSKAAAGVAGIVAVAWNSGLAMAAADPYQLNLPEPQTVIAQQIYDQHILVLWICLAIFIGVFGVMFYSVVKHRKSKGYEAANFHHSTTVEIIWTAIPFLILVGMAFPATKTIIAMKDTSNPDITVKATGYQWKCGYDYLRSEESR